MKIIISGSLILIMAFLIVMCKKEYFVENMGVNYNATLIIDEKYNTVKISEKVRWINDSGLDLNKVLLYCDAFDSSTVLLTCSVNNIEATPDFFYDFANQLRGVVISLPFSIGNGKNMDVVLEYMQSKIDTLSAQDVIFFRDCIPRVMNKRGNYYVKVIAPDSIDIATSGALSGEEQLFDGKRVFNYIGEGIEKFSIVCFK